MSEKKYISVTFSQSFEVDQYTNESEYLQRAIQLRDHIYKVCDDTDFSINVDGIKKLGPTSISFRELNMEHKKV